MSDTDNRETVKNLLKKVERIVVKVGTNLIDCNMGFNLPMLAGLVSDIAAIRQIGKEVLLVTSGAVGAGRRLIEGMDSYPKSIPEKQACAALGQARLMHLYQELFRYYGYNVAQVLLTEEEIKDRQRYINVQNTLEQLLSWGSIPIINENDTVATDELKFGDNDRLSALVAGKVQAQLLILLTDVDGLYDRPPSEPGATLINYVSEITPELEAIAGTEGSKCSIGGMKAKLSATETCMRRGILTAIANGNRQAILPAVISGQGPATWFLPSLNPLTSRKAWLLSRQRICNGTVYIDDGAKEALCERGKSLLPIGVKKVEGAFDRKETVCISDMNGHELARGLVNFSSEDLLKVIGLKTSDIGNILGPDRCEEVIHRDDLVILE